jgi:hypothetical protein
LYIFIVGAVGLGDFSIIYKANKSGLPSNYIVTGTSSAALDKQIKCFKE